MLTMYYQTTCAVARPEEEKVIDFSAFLPEKRVCRPLVWDAAPTPRRRRRAARWRRALEAGVSLSLLAAAVLVPLLLLV